MGPLKAVFSALAMVVAMTLGTAAPRAEGAAPASPSFDAAAAVADAAQTLSSERAGVVSLRRHVAAQQHAPAHDGTLDEQAGFVREGDRVVAVRVYAQKTAGAAAAALAKTQAAAEKNLPDDDYRLPLREDALGDYTFASAACAACPDGAVAVAFTSLKRDEIHGDGTAVIDPSAHHFLRIDFVPSVLPQHVDKASIAIVFGGVLPDLWDVVDMEQHYSGHVLFISGGADITTSLSNYRRFTSRDDALKALDAGV